MTKLKIIDTANNTQAHIKSRHSLIYYKQNKMYKDKTDNYKPRLKLYYLRKETTLSKSHFH